MSLRWCRARCEQCGQPAWAEDKERARAAPAAAGPAPASCPKAAPPAPPAALGPKARKRAGLTALRGDERAVTCRRCRLGLQQPEAWCQPLSRAEVHGLQSRELTPEDYELLLRLDEAVEPRSGQALTAEECEACLLPADPPPGGVPGEGAPTCAICLADFEEDCGEARRLAGCGHVFHGPCIRQWLTGKKGTCPLDGLSALGPRGAGPPAAPLLRA